MARYIGDYEVSDNSKRLGGRGRYYTITYSQVLIMCLSLLLLGVYSGWIEKEINILPFSSITPGMKINKIRKLEPQISEYNQISKRYKDVTFYADLSDGRNIERITWVCSSSQINQYANVETVIIEVERYCNQQYDIWKTVSTEKGEIMSWRVNNKYYIDMLVVKEGEHLQAIIDIYKKTERGMLQNNEFVK